MFSLSRCVIIYVVSDYLLAGTSSRTRCVIAFIRVSDYSLGSHSFLHACPLAVRGTISAYDLGEVRLRDSMAASPLRRSGS
jgi:hypothetical protein